MQEVQLKIWTRLGYYRSEASSRTLAFLPKIWCLLGYGDRVWPAQPCYNCVDRDGHFFL
jgi:hypothetical protein